MIHKYPQLHLYIYIFCSTVGREAVGAPELKRHCPQAPQFAYAAALCSVQNLQHQLCWLWGLAAAAVLSVLPLSTPRPTRTPLMPAPPCFLLPLLALPGQTAPPSPLLLAPPSPSRMPTAVPGCFLLPLLPPPPLPCPGPPAAG